MRIEKGILYVRLLRGRFDCLFYTDDKKVPENYNAFHAREIVSMSLGTLAKPLFLDYFETVQHGKTTAFGALVEFRKATDSDIRNFLDRWDPDAEITINEWVTKVQREHPDLASEEKERLLRIARDY